MLKKLHLLSALFALTIMLVAAAAPMAQNGPARNPIDIKVRDQQIDDHPQVELPTLRCCECLGKTNTLDLSTVSSNHWTVKNPANVTSAVTYVSPKHSAWTLPTGAAQWVSTTANGYTSQPAGVYEYRLQFRVPECVIGQTVTLSGNVGGDDDIAVYLDNTTNVLSTCSGGGCFGPNTPPALYAVVAPPGVHTLIVRVTNGGGPTGMFVNARLTGQCCSGKPLDPNFTLNATLAGNAPTFSLNATTAALPSGAGFWWRVEEIDASGNVVANTTLTNPSSWWSTPTSTNFSGYCCNNASSPPGVFLQGHKYRITRGVWDACTPWRAVSKTISICNNCKTKGPQIEDVPAPASRPSDSGTQIRPR